jgi:hypothetical protein
MDEIFAAPRRAITARMRDRSLLLVGVVLASCGASTGPVVSPDEPLEHALASLEARGPELRARCARHAGDDEACEADLACAVGPPIGSCDHGVCTGGGPASCLACLAAVALRESALDPESCALRASGRTEEAARHLAERRLVGTD